MSTEIVPAVDFSKATDIPIVTTDATVLYSESAVLPEYDYDERNFTLSNGTNFEEFNYSGYAPLFQVFIILEIIMTTVELLISIIAMIKMPRWRRNYRNQMLLQLSLARLIKRVIFTVKFCIDQDYISETNQLNVFLNSSQIYIDLVIVILVFYFIKHMYNCLIIVLVKISQNNLYRELGFSWLLPVPITAIFTAILVTEVLDKWTVYFVICCVFRWPLIFIGTGLYITILYKVMSDKIRHFARSLTVVTFFLCLLINIYLFSKDIIELWCMQTYFTTILISYISGFLMNCFILCLYIVLLILSFNNKTQSGNHLDRSVARYSVADTIEKW